MNNPYPAFGMSGPIFRNRLCNPVSHGLSGWTQVNTAIGKATN
jgi:hypothetical protein